MDKYGAVLLSIYASLVILPISAYFFGRKKIGRSFAWNTLLFYIFMYSAWNTCCGGFGLGYLALFLSLPIYIVIYIIWTGTVFFSESSSKDLKKSLEKVWLLVLGILILFCCLYLDYL